MAPAAARREARSTRQSPNLEAKTEAVEDLEARSPKFTPELESKLELLVKDQSKRGSPKRVSKPEVRVEAGRILLEVGI